MNTITNKYYVEIDFDVAVSYMDGEICEELNREIAPCTDQEFFDHYCKAHFDKYGEEFELDKRNPCY